MDSPASHRISVPGGTQDTGWCHSVFAYRTVTFYGRLSHTILLTVRLSYAGPTTPQVQALAVWAVPRSLATTEGIISFPLGTKMFQFPRFPSLKYVFNKRSCGFAAGGFPIRISSDQRLCTAPRGFSQCPTSFVGTYRQGIHRKLLVT